MANSLLIEKQTGGYFKFTLNGDTTNAITSIQNDLLAVGNQLHFKTGNGANIIKEQFIYPEDITIISGGTFTFTTVAQVWDKLIDIDYFAWLGGGGSIGIDRFDDLVDTFKYTGNAGKTVVVDNSELRLIPITLYNKRLFTELEDTPSSLVPDKMVVVNPAGTALILKDQPEQPEQLLNSVGYFDYNDLITQTTPLNAAANVALKLTNDTEGANTSTDQNPYGVSYVWDYTTNQFNFNELEVGDTIDVRIHVQVTTTTSNQKVDLKAKLGIGSASEFTNTIYENQFKSAGLHEVSVVAPFYMGSTDITDNPAELYLTTDSSATVKVDGWYVRILRKNINIITVDYTVPDATTTVKGIVRLAGDLAGTANSPTVPELANKVPNTRTVSTTSPLLGGGALSSNLTLSIQQANSVDSGYLTYADWGRFDEAHKDRIVSAAVTGTTTKTLTLTQHDAGTITTSWTDDNTDAVSSVFGRTGAVVAVSGDYTTSLVTEGTNLYYTNARVSANTDVAANTAARHNAVTIGTANGLSLSTQALSLALASASANGALSSTDWNTFNGKQAALSGTGFVKISGTTISYDNSTYALDSAVVKLAGAQTVTGLKTFSNMPILSAASSVDGQIVYADANNQLKTITNFKYNDTTGVITTLLGNLGSNAYTSTAYQPLLTNPITGTGITNYLPKFIGSTVLGNSSIYDNGTGAVGIGAVPSNWDSAWKALQVSDASFIGNADELLISHNLYKIGEDTKYISSSRYGSLYSQNSGAHWFATAPIGTAGANATLTTRMILTNDGKLGIGTTSPSAKLNVSGDIHLGSYSDTSINTYEIRTNKALFSIASDGVTNGNGTLITYSWANGGQGPLRFNNASGEVMRLSSSGNVGIGTTSPSTLFHIYKASFPILTIQSSSYQSSLGIDTTSGNLVLNNESNAPLSFNTNATERMRITSGGNVGIGTTSPSGKLHVVGEGIFDDGTNGRLTFANASSQNDIYSTTTSFGGWKNLRLSSNELILSSGGTTERMRITSGGDVLVGTTISHYASAGRGNVTVSGSSQAIYALAINGVGKGYLYHEGTNAYIENSVSGGKVYVISGNSGGVYLSSGATSWTANSDNRLKDINYTIENAVDKLCTLNPVSFAWKSDESKKEVLGLIAQDVEKVFPQIIDRNKLSKSIDDDSEIDETEYLGVRYQELIPVLVKAIQELNDKINKLENK